MNSTKVTIFAILGVIVLLVTMFLGILHFREQMVIDSAAQTAKIVRNLNHEHELPK
jgi:hypothetical protein